MNREERILIIEKRLQMAFLPNNLEVLDDSDQHIGHEGSKDGAGHYTVKIAADYFKNKNRIDIHRDIYKVLEDLIPHEIHALRIIQK